MIFRKWRRLLLRLQSLTIGFFQLPLFSEGVRLADKSIRMEGALGSGSPWHFKLAKYQATRPIFRYVAQYVLFRIISERWRRSSQNCWITFSPWCFAVQNVCLKEEGVLAGTLFMTFQTCNIPSFGANIWYVAQYIIYRNISDGKRRTNKDCWITFEKSCSAVRSERLPQRRRSFGRKTVHANSNIENTQATGQYFDMLLNMFDIESYPTDSVARAKVVELPLTLWSSCGCKCRDCFDRSNCMEELWDRGPPRHFEHWKYPSYEANISICCSICYILKHIWRTASLA